MPGRVTGAIVNSWLVKGGRTVVRRLALREAPAGAIAEVRCHGRALPVGAALDGDRRARRRPAHAVVPAAGCGPGSCSRCAVTAPNAIGKVVRYTLRREKLPRVRRLCLPPGARRPGPADAPR